MSFRKSARVAFIADDKQYHAALNRLQREAKKTADKMNSISAAAAKAFAAAGAVEAGLIALYHTQAQAEIGVAAAIRNTGKAHEYSVDKIKAYSTQIQRSSIYGDEAAIAATTLGIRLGNLSQEQLPRAVRLFADMGTVMGRDLVASARQVAKYLADPQQGMARLSQAGITLTEDTKELIRTLMAQGRVVEAQNELMRQLELRFSGASQAALKSTGIIAATKNALGDLGEKIGKLLFGYVQPWLEKLKALAESLQENEKFIRFAAEAIRRFIIVMAGMAIITKVVALLALLKPALIAVAGAFTRTGFAAKGMWAAATLGATTFLAFLPEIYEWFVDKLIPALDKYKKKWDDIVEGNIDDNLARVEQQFSEGKIDRKEYVRQRSYWTGLKFRRSRQKEDREYDFSILRNTHLAEGEAAEAPGMPEIEDEAEEKARTAREDRMRQNALDLEVLRMKLEGEEELEIAHRERMMELKLEWDSLDRIADEEERRQRRDKNKAERKL